MTLRARRWLAFAKVYGLLAASMANLYAAAHLHRSWFLLPMLAFLVAAQVYASTVKLR